MRAGARVPRAFLLSTAFLAACGSPEKSEPPREMSTHAGTAAVPSSTYAVVGAIPDAGSLAGTVTLAAPVPSLKPRPVNADAKVCGAGERANPTLVLGKKNGIANAVVSIAGVSRGKPFANGAPLLDQKTCTFVPYVQVAPKGAEVTFVNSDPVNHNVHAYDAANTSLFNLAMPIQNLKLTQKLDVPGPVRIKCDAHSWMTAWIWTSETPYAVVTDANGRYALKDVPPGTYRLHVWHELLGEKDETVVVPPKVEATHDVALSVGG